MEIYYIYIKPQKIKQKKTQKILGLILLALIFLIRPEKTDVSVPKGVKKGEKKG